VRKGFGLFKYIILTAAVAAAVWFWYAQSSRQETAVRPPKPPVKIISPVRGSIQRTLTIGGHIEAEEMVTVLPRVSGQIEEIPVKEGDMIGEGDVIARLDAEALMLQLQQAEAAYRSAESSYERIERLYRSGGATTQEFEEARSRYESYKAQYGLARLQLTYASVKAPMSGIILKKHANAGSLAAPEVPLVTIADLDTLIVKSSIPERYYDRFVSHSGDISVSITRPSYAGTFDMNGGMDDMEYGGDATAAVSAASGQSAGGGISGRIANVSSFISAETRNFTVTVEVDDAAAGQKGLRPGMYVETTYVLDERKDVFTLPYTVLTSGNTLWYIETDPQGEATAYSMNIQIDFSNEERFVLPEEYRNYRFISEGQHFLRDGQAVQIISGEQQP